MKNDFIYKPGSFMPLWITLLLGLTLSCSMCKKTDVPEDDTPRCIKDKIKNYEKDPCLDRVYEYDYKGEKVYLFATNNNNCGATLYDESCNVICTFGGFAGSAGSCQDFHQTRTNEKLIWKK